MKKILTDNIGLKILSLLASMILWTIVVNVDDPVITRTYSNIPVEIINSSVITQDGKTYEVLDGTDVVTVVVQANRSVIEAMSRDYIKATADMRDITIMNTVAIEVKSTRYSDRIESISSRTKSLEVQIEDLKQKDVDITIQTVGQPEDGYVVGTMSQSASSLTVSGPASVISMIDKAQVAVDISGISNDVMYDPVIELLDEEGNLLDKKNLTLSMDTVHLVADVLKTKDIGVSFVVSGTTSEGYGFTGAVLSKPNSVLIAGEGKAFEELTSIAIPDVLSIADATDDVTISVNIKDYLPNEILLADTSFDGNITATAYVEPCTIREFSIPVSDITINNLPEGYVAVIVSETGNVDVMVQGVGEAIKQFDPDELKGSLDATALTPKLLDGGNIVEGNLNVGILEGQVSFNLPSGLTISHPVTVTVNMAAVADPTVFNQNSDAPAENTEGENVEAPVTEEATQEENTVSEVQPEAEVPVIEIPTENTEQLPATE